MEANANEIPINAEKVLFVVDVVRFFLNTRYPELSARFVKKENSDIAGLCRESIHKRFNENIRRIISTIDDTQSFLVRKDFLEMVSQGEINPASLHEYNRTYRTIYCSNGFEARSFLMYCARVALMACCFFSTGMLDVLDIAVDLIVSEFPEDQNLSSSVWDSLNEADAENSDAVSFASKSPISTWRETKAIISSETEDSSSSTVNSESDSTVDMQIVPSTSETQFADSLTGEIGKLSVSSVEPADLGSSTCTSVSTQTEEFRSLPDSLSEPSFHKPVIFVDDDRQNPSSTSLEMDTSPERTSKPATDESQSSKSSLGKRTSPRKEKEVESEDVGKLEATPSPVKKLRLCESEKSE